MPVLDSHGLQEDFNLVESDEEFRRRGMKDLAVGLVRSLPFGTLAWAPSIVAASRQLLTRLARKISSLKEAFHEVEASYLSSVFAAEEEERQAWALARV